MLWSTQVAMAFDKAELAADSREALKHLYAKVPQAKTLEPKAKAILIFPNITKAGIGIGGQYGRGVLYVKGKVAGYYSTSGASYGLQLGAQKYGYAMFLMSSKALDDLKEGQGLEVGVGPTVTVVDEGFAQSISTTTIKSDVYAFIFEQKGLMAGVGLQGNKISKID
jgi:lipid-binding SYLF domain-containing protein